jgi:hypothetical protein
MSTPIDINEDSQVKLDIKSLVAIIIGILAIAGVWFTLTAQLSQLQLDVVRMQDAVGMNSEFRVKWPRGELGALPDDAKQDLRIEYLQKDLEELKAQLKKLREICSEKGFEGKF